jgi:hypothetical protein
VGLSMHTFTYFIEIQYGKYCGVEYEFFFFHIVRLVFSGNAVYEPAERELNILHKTPQEMLYTILWSTCFQMMFCILYCPKELHGFLVIQDFWALNWPFSYTRKPRARYAVLAKN